MIDSVGGTNFCCFEEVKWRVANRGLVWVGGRNKDSDGAESNGSGKSSLFKLLSWVLYGKTIDDDNTDGVIKEGAKAAHTWAELGEYRVTRVRHKGSVKLKLFLKGEPVGGSTKEIQARIDKILGMDWETFRNTVLYGQRDSKRFLSADDATKKALLHRVLKTSAISVAHEAAKEEGRRLKRLVQDVETKYERATAALVEYDLESLKAESDKWKGERRERIEKQKANARAYLKEAKDIADSSPDVEDLEKNISYLDVILDTAEDVALKQDKAEARRANLSTLQTEQKFEIQRANAAIEQIEGSLEDFEDATECPMCHGPLEGKEAKAHISELRVKLAEEEHARDAAKETREKHLDERKAAIAELEECGEANERIRHVRKQRTQLRDQISEARQVEFNAEKEREKARQAVARAKEIAAEENPHKAAYTKAKKRNKELSEEVEAAKEEIQKLQNDLAHVQFWVQGFGPSGLPSFMLDAVMPTLTERANFYLERLSDGDITMEFSTQRELKSGEQRDKIGVTWRIEGATEGHAPSGGQWKKMELATDFALMDIVAAKDNAHPELLLLDECLDGLDAEGRNRVSQLLHSMRSVRRSIFVISHEPQMSEVFERGIQVSKRGGTATLEEVAA